MDKMGDLLKTPTDELYNYSLVLPLEREFSPVPSTIWMQQNWHHSLTISLIYALSIFIGQKFMSKRAPFELDKWLTLWNTFLAIFSIMGSLRFTPEFFNALTTRGFQYSICSASYMQIPTTSFWAMLFVFSKVFELFDTAFIVLRKRPLIFLHWYHHITVLIVAWHAYMGHTASGRWIIWMNFTVHAFMYSYYALRSRGVRFPKWIPMSITCIQLVQMFFGCAITIQAYRTRVAGHFCQQTYENMSLAFGIYSTYFLLFARFFYDAYLKKGNRFQLHQKKFKEESEGKVQNGHLNGAERYEKKVQNGSVEDKVIRERKVQ